jgi:hypothetical protein
MSGFKVDASLKGTPDKDFEDQKAALQLEMDRRAALLSAANQTTRAPSYPSRGVITSTGDVKFTPTGSFFNQQSQQPNIMDTSDFFTQVGSKNYQDWPAVSSSLPAGLAGLRVPLGIAQTQQLQSMRPKQTAEDFAARAKSGLLNDLNKGGKSHRRRAKKAKRSRKARRASRRSRRASRRSRRAMMFTR